MAQDTTKIALITGSSRGVGRNMALALAQKEVDVIVTYRSNEAEAKNVVSAIEGMGVVKLLHCNWIRLTPKPLTISRHKSSNHSRTTGKQNSLISSLTTLGLVFMHRLQKQLRKNSIA